MTSKDQSANAHAKSEDVSASCLASYSDIVQASTYFKKDAPLKFYQKHEHDPKYQIKDKVKKTLFIISFEDHNTLYTDEANGLIASSEKVYFIQTKKTFTLQLLSNDRSPQVHEILMLDINKWSVTIKSEKLQEFVFQFRNLECQIINTFDKEKVAKFTVKHDETKLGTLIFVSSLSNLNMMILTFAFGYIKYSKKMLFDRNPAKLALSSFGVATLAHSIGG